MQVTYKGKKHQIICDSDMPLYTEDGTEGCNQSVALCKQCILKHLDVEKNEGWDDEANIKYDMRLTIGNDSIRI